MKNLIIGLVLAIAIVFGIIYLTNKNETARIEKYMELSSKEVAMICTTDMATEYHIHPLLKIYINKEEVIVPANTGITNNCMNSIHTHEEPHVLHVEAPVQKDFTLGANIISSISWEKVLIELDKCDLLCYNCHRIRHSNYENEIFLKYCK